MLVKRYCGLLLSVFFIAALAIAGCAPEPIDNESEAVDASTKEAPPKATTAEPGLSEPATRLATAPATEQKAVTVADTEPAASGVPRIHSDEPTFNFGRVDNLGKVEHGFVVKNTGDAPLELGKVKTSCGCTVAQIPKSVLEPGEETTIQATLSLKGKQGTQTTTITVPSNDPKTPNYQLKFTGVAVASISIEPLNLNFGQIEGDSLLEDRTLSVKAAEKDVTFDITHVQCSSPYFETSVEVVEPGKAYQIVVSNVKPLKEGPIVGQIRIDTDDKARPSLSVSIYGSVVGDIVVVPSRVSVSYNPDPDRRTSQYILIAAGRVKEFEITEVISPLEEVEVEFSPRQAKFSEYLVKLTNMPVNGVLDGKELIIKTNIPGNSEVRIPFINKQTNRTRNLIQRPAPTRPASRTKTVQ